MSPAVCAQPHPLSTDTPAAANQLVARERQAWWVRVKRVCVFLRVCVGRETRPRQAGPVTGTSGAWDELETQKKTAEETFFLLGNVHLLQLDHSRGRQNTPHCPDASWDSLETPGRLWTLRTARCSSPQKNHPGALRQVKLTTAGGRSCELDQPHDWLEDR